MDAENKVADNNFTSDDMGACSSGRDYYCRCNYPDILWRKLLAKTAELAGYC